MTHVRKRFALRFIAACLSRGPDPGYQTARGFHVILPIYIASGFMTITELAKAYESPRCGTLMDTSKGALRAFLELATARPDR